LNTRSLKGKNLRTINSTGDNSTQAALAEDRPAKPTIHCQNS